MLSVIIVIPATTKPEDSQSTDADYVDYWDADLATPRETISAFCELLDSRPDHWRRAVRHYLTRLFATTASVVLGVAIHDTQCGAKPFRVSPEVPPLFQHPFVTRWLFEVEILARLIHAHRGTNWPPIEAIIYEFPLQEWHNVAGSKVKLYDFSKAFFGLAIIYWKYPRLRTST
jgi:dolichyl-phosphate beta-glucosyltransferase